jgi:pSer/pThr/pTyr-binding forkhead associated (FHA) protein
MLAAVAADLERHLRIGSLEVTIALALVALVAARPRVRAAADIGALTPMRVDLDVLERDARRTVQVRAPAEIGRTREADVFLRDAEVSRRHARLETHSGTLYVEDLQSSNGTFLNGRRVTDALEVREGDAIDVGTTRLLVIAVRPD